MTKFDGIKNGLYLLEYRSIENETPTNEQLGVLAVQRCLFRLPKDLFSERICFKECPVYYLRRLQTKTLKPKTGVLT